MLIINTVGVVYYLPLSTKAFRRGNEHVWSNMLKSVGTENGINDVSMLVTHLQ